MKNLRLLFLFYISCFVFISCVTKFNPDVSDYEYALVVDGRVTNQKKVHAVKLSKSYNYSQTKGEAVKGAIVKVISDKGQVEILTERSEGVYETRADYYSEVGTGYKLFIQDGENVYESDFEKMLPINKIDSVFWEPKTNQTNGMYVQLYISSGSKGSGVESDYYKWEICETWKFSPHIHESNARPYWYCWQNFSAPSYYISSSEGLANNVIDKYPINFITNETKRLFFRYSINVFQYSLSKDAYQYFKSIKEQVENKSTLFEKTPVTLSSNIYCVSDKKEIVLGYFQISSVDSSRIFIDNSELPEDFTWTGLVDVDDQCQRKDILIALGHTIDRRLIIDTALRINELTSSIDTCLIYYYNRKCFDCTATGFPNVPPDYWKE